MRRGGVAQGRPSRRCVVNVSGQREASPFSLKSFVLTSFAVFIACYLATVIGFGIVWDPNGAILLERPLAQTARIVATGLAMSLPLACAAFLVPHPVPPIMGAAFAIVAALAWMGRRTVHCRAIAYVLIGAFTVLGTVRFFLMA